MAMFHKGVKEATTQRAGLVIDLLASVVNADVRKRLQDELHETLENFEERIIEQESCVIAYERPTTGETFCPSCVSRCVDSEHKLYRIAGKAFGVTPVILESLNFMDCDSEGVDTCERCGNELY